MSTSAYLNESQPMANQTATRRKTVAACERCREKRIKCNGTQPCLQCERKQAQCIFTTGGPPNSLGNDAIAEKLDLVLSRLERVERSTNRLMFSRRPHGQDNNEDRAIPGTKRPRGLAQLNRQTRCLEYYGNTSAFVAASSLIERIRQLEDDSELPNGAKKRRLEDAFPADHLESLGLEEVPGFCDYIAPPNTIRPDRSLRISIADKHLDNFFSTIHIFIPILDQTDFRARYQTLRSLFGDRRLAVSTLEDPGRPQFVCLLYAVLALGALYEYGTESSSLWASWYFAEAQDMLGRLLEATNMHLVQAALLLGAYAQHAIKPNLAYILTGMATRLAFSIGLNIESLHKSLPYNIEESRRTYWMIYAQEVELSLDSGRPISLPSSQMGVEYPASQVAVAQPSPTIFIQCLAKVAKILRKILDLMRSLEEQQYSTVVDDFESLRQELLLWRDELPPHLQLENEVESDETAAGLSNWERRQQSSLRIHFNLGVIILLRGSLKRSISRSTVGDAEMLSLHQSFCLEAARDMIRHIAALFHLAPHLRAWSYYCFYCLQATLIILPKLVSEDHAARSSPTALPENDWEICNLAVRVFEQIELKASQRCAEVVKQFLKRWKRVKTTEGPHLMASKKSPLYGTQSLWERTKPRAESNKSSDNVSLLPTPAPATQSSLEEQSTPQLDASGGGSIARTSPGSLSELRGELYGAFYSQNGPGNPDLSGRGYSFAEDYSFMGNLPPDIGTDWDWASIMGFEGSSV